MFRKGCFQSRTWGSQKAELVNDQKVEREQKITEYSERKSFVVSKCKAQSCLVIERTERTINAKTRKPRSQNVVVERANNHQNIKRRVSKYFKQKGPRF